MNVKRNTLIAGAAAAILAVGGVGVANAVSDDDGGATGPGAAQAKAAALRLIPGGHVNAIERDGEKGATWEVEVRKPDGSTVDVRLDANYEAVAIDRDSEGN
jgi:uncharacterized membrane protein YkoI